ncbi:MAG: MBL fold metallo-hydrolase [Muribaculaceae bacterium]|nr:MBL fold metallo-hydrolase [Muribaculaceae bacterium]
MCEVVMLGTGNAMCTRCYNTCFFLRTPGGGMMVDAGGGNGIFNQLQRAGVAITEVHHLFVTHCHTDHIMGVVWMIRKISPMIHKGAFRGTLTIYCHDEAEHALRTMCALMMPRKIYSELDHGIVLRVVRDGERMAVDDMQVTFFDIGSTKTKQFGFSAILPDGRRLTCLGDEPYKPVSEQYVRGCDWLLCEAFCLYADREQHRAYEKHHSTVLDAARAAQELQVENLLLYHTVDAGLATRAQRFAAEARTVFAGHVVVPDDLQRVTL